MTTDHDHQHSKQKCVFSGVQPTGNLHLGNYLGAITRFVELQQHHECLYCVVDLHAITLKQNPAMLAQNIRNVTAAFIAAGLNPEQSILFNQSQVPEHAELQWILNCTARIGWLNRMTQFKEKAGKNRENASVGLYVYPILMAADILAYKTTHVPVGEDQKQHLELCRDIAQKFNHDFKCTFFPNPEPLITESAPRIMSLKDGTVKMSKSDPSDMARINLTDTADQIAKKIKKAKTDPHPIPETKDALKKRPEAENLIGIFAALEGKKQSQIIREYAGKPFSNLKNNLAQCAIETLAPITKTMRNLLKHEDEIDKILKNGAQKAQEKAQPIVQDVKKIIGFIR